EELAVRRELPDGVVAVVRRVHGVVGADRDAVRPVREVALAPGVDELSARVVNDDRMVAAADQEDAVLQVAGNSGDVTVLEPLGQLLPTFDDVQTHGGSPAAHSTAMPTRSSAWR